jgi:hypothetical protein
VHGGAQLPMVTWREGKGEEEGGCDFRLVWFGLDAFLAKPGLQLAGKQIKTLLVSKKKGINDLRYFLAASLLNTATSHITTCPIADFISLESSERTLLWNFLNRKILLFNSYTVRSPSHNYLMQFKSPCLCSSYEFSLILFMFRVIN